MPACTEKESNLQNGRSQGGGSFRNNLHMLRLDLSLINRNISSFMVGEVENENWGAPANDAVGDRVFDRTEDYDIDSEEFSVFNYTDDDDDAQSLVRCPFCDFELDFSATRCHLDVITFDPTNMVCPVCDEKVGEDVNGKLISLKTLKSEKSSGSSGNSSPMLGKKLAGRGNHHDEPMADAFLSPFIYNASGRKPCIHPCEYSNSNASDISNAKSFGTCAPDMGDEEDHEERRLRASFVQQLVLSTLF